LIEGLCLPKASSLFVALLDYLKGITGHIGQIADKLSRVGSLRMYLGSILVRPYNGESAQGAAVATYCCNQVV
jgi:hypothetical protein